MIKRAIAQGVAPFFEAFKILFYFLIFLKRFIGLELIYKYLFGLSKSITEF